MGEVRQNALGHVANLQRAVGELSAQLADSRRENRELVSERNALRNQLTLAQLDGIGGDDVSVQNEIGAQMERLTRDLKARCEELEDALAQHAEHSDHSAAEASILEEQVVCMQSIVELLLAEQSK